VKHQKRCYWRFSSRTSTKITERCPDFRRNFRPFTGIYLCMSTVWSVKVDGNKPLFFWNLIPFICISHWSTTFIICFCIKCAKCGNIVTESEPRFCRAHQLETDRLTSDSRQWSVTDIGCYVILAVDVVVKRKSLSQVQTTSVPQHELHYWTFVEFCSIQEMLWNRDVA
jgi:hypothetical protein